MEILCGFIIYLAEEMMGDVIDVCRQAIFLVWMAVFPVKQ